MSPTIVLLGGRFRLDSGVDLDSRQPIKDDPWDLLLRAALSSSEAWWTAARDFVNVVLDQDEDRAAWALLWASRTVVRADAMGSHKRVRMAKLFGELDRLAKFHEGHRMLADRSSARYRSLEYSLRFKDVRSNDGPSVFVGAFHDTYPDGTDFVGVAPLDVVRKLWPSAILVLPHTPQVERKVGMLLANQEDVPDKGTPFHHDSKDSAEYAAAREQADELLKSGPTAVDGDFRATYFVDRGQVRDAGDLAAAFDFVRSRYDLRVGLWDLARDPILRQSLLQRQQGGDLDEGPRDMPAKAQKAFASSRRAREARAEDERQHREQLHAVLWPLLQPLGWRIGSQPHRCKNER